MHFSKLVNSEEDITLVPLDERNVWVDIFVDLILGELARLILQYIVLLPFCLLHLVFLHKLSKADFPVDIWSVDHLFVFILWRDVRHFLYGKLHFGAADQETARDERGYLHYYWFGKQHYNHECTSNYVDDRMELRNTRGTKVLTVIQPLRRTRHLVGLQQIRFS